VFKFLFFSVPDLHSEDIALQDPLFRGTPEQNPKHSKEEIEAY
jgi:hypothetical protein